MSIFDLVPVPDILDAKRILCVQPHPDDMEVSCGGTLARLSDLGAHITYLTVTDGGAGSSIRQDENKLAALRHEEQLQAGKIIGVQDYRWLNQRDADYLASEKLQTDIIQAIREVKPDTVITLDPWLPYEAHPAHRNVGLCVAAAVLFSGIPNIPANSLESTGHEVFCIAFGFTAKPNTFVDITTTWPRKVDAIRAHASQFPEESWPFYGQYFAAKAMQYGGPMGVEKAEALKVLRPVHLHCNVDAIDM
jgi:N,N'-diacetylchitobiose non-reducing end deacetylase